MKTEHTNYQAQIDQLKKMLIGSKVAQLLSIIYALISFIFAYKKIEELEYSIPLLVGGLVLIWFSTKYLSLKTIKSKTITVSSINSNIKKYKTHLSERKRYEAFVMLFWLFTLLPIYFEYSGYSSTSYINAGVILVLIIFIGQFFFKIAEQKLTEIELGIQNLKH